MTGVNSVTDAAGAKGARRPLGDRPRLVLLSFLMLFVELALIRWTGSNVVYLSFFSNFVLLGSFLGIGLGFLRARRAHDLFPFAPLVLLALVAFIRYVPVEIERGGGDQLIFFGGLEASGPPRWLVLTVIFLAVAAAMAFIGEGVARTFARFEPLEAYKLDLVGSVLGIVGFSSLSLLRAPSVAWGAVAAVVFLVLYAPRVQWLQVLPLAAIVVILALESFAPNTSWSPYYKVTVDPDTDVGTLEVDVNGVPHQFHQTADEAPGRAVYDVARPGSLENVLIIGAGGGNDVSVALEHGAEHVDAVEIDPRLYELGKELHPDHPYDDPRVDVHITDGRAFLERTDDEYDLILLALPDSITLIAGQSSLRLESYLFTREAIEAARDHLAPEGVFAMYNYYREHWLEDRFANTLAQVFGHPPCAQFFGGEDFRLGVLVDSVDPAAVECTGDVAAPWTPTVSNVPAPATDDHPFPYLRANTLPSFYAISILLILLASAVLVRLTAGPMRPMLGYLDLFFMGAAFLLLETKNVVQFALLFGTTWFVNALVFLAVILSVLLAVVVAQRVTFRRPARLYAVLLAAIAVAYLVPQHDLLALDPVPRFLAAAALAFFPIFTANLVFAERFKETGDSTTAFGANLLGAMVGGVLEYSALVVGYRNLLIVVAALYGLAFFFGRTHLAREVDRRPDSAAPVAS